MNYVVDNIGKVVTAIRVWNNTADEGAPYYMYGHKVEINNELQSKNHKSAHQNRKYPLIMLNMDVAEMVESGVVKYTLNIAIVAMTKENYTAQQRFEKVIKPVLAPLYDQLIEGLQLSPDFFWPGNQSIPPHTRVIRPYWGKTALNKNDELTFDDPLDAIELINLKINSNVKTC